MRRRRWLAALVLVALLGAGWLWFGGVGDPAVVAAPVRDAALDSAPMGVEVAPLAVSAEVLDTDAGKPLRPPGAGITVGDESPAPRRDVGDLFVLVVDSRGAPLAGIGMVAMSPRWGPFGEELGGTSDAEGRALLAGVPVGDCMVRSDRGGQVLCKVQADTVTEVLLELLGGVFLEGRVVGPGGQAVPDAEVWLSETATSPDAQLVAHSDAAGRFAVDGVPSGRQLCARHQAHAASRRQRVIGAVGERVWIELALGPAPATVSGRVVDEEGRGISGARLVVGALAEWDRGPQDPGPAAVHGISDEQGRFQLGGLPAGTVRVHALAPGFTAGRSTPLELEPGQRIEVDVPLSPGGLLVGTVYDADGAPLPLVSVDVDAGTGQRCPWPLWATTDERGHYSLDTLPTGDVLASARHSDGRVVQATLKLVAGESVTWNPLFVDGERIHGRLVDPGLAPLSAWMVTYAAMDNPQRGLGGVLTDELGRFSFTLDDQGAAAAPFTLAVRAVSAPNVARLTVPGVVPRAEPYELILDPQAPAGAVVRGDILDALGAPLVGAELLVSGPGGKISVTIDGRGVFESDPLSAGEYLLQFDSGEGVDLALSVTVADRDLLLGTLRVAEPGVLQLSARQPTAVQITGALGQIARQVIVNEVLDVSLPAGNYVVQRSVGPRSLVDLAEVTVQAGGTTVFQLPGDGG